MRPRSEPLRRTRVHVCRNITFQNLLRIFSLTTLASCTGDDTCPDRADDQSDADWQAACEATKYDPQCLDDSSPLANDPEDKAWTQADCDAKAVEDGKAGVYTFQDTACAFTPPQGSSPAA